LQSASKHDLQPENGYCSVQRRVLVVLYDGIILIGLLMIGSALALPFGDIHKTAFQDFWFTLWLMLICFAYLGGCWHYGGMTVGMRAWKVKLINQQGELVSWPGCLLRFFVAAISLATFGMGFLWALYDPKNRAWHDLAASTLLIKINQDIR